MIRRCGGAAGEIASVAQDAPSTPRTGGTSASAVKASRPAIALPTPSVATDAGTADRLAQIYREGAVMTPRINEIRAAIQKQIVQCYDTVHAQRPDVRGRLVMSVTLKYETEAGNLIAHADLDRTATTISDRELLECATENVYSAEQVLEKLRAEHDTTGGNVVFKYDLEFPLVPKAKPPWPSNDASPTCEPGTVLAGDKPPRGTSQWCALPNGAKQGEEYEWSDGVLDVIMIFDHGQSSQVRMRPSNED